MEPFIAEGSGSELHPELAETLASGELYNRVLCRWLHPSGLPAVGGHWAVIQALARRGLYVVDTEDTPVTENDLLELPLHTVRLQPNVVTRFEPIIDGLDLYHP